MRTLYNFALHEQPILEDQTHQLSHYLKVLTALGEFVISPLSGNCKSEQAQIIIEPLVQAFSAPNMLSSAYNFSKITITLEPL